jgi:hypothetical protein
MNKNKFITSAKRPNKNDGKKGLYTFIIIADTPGYRMKSYGPTTLINLNNYKLIDIQIDSIKSCFNNFEIIICCGSDSEKVYKHIKNHHADKSIRIIENQIYNNSNTCESLRLAINNTSNDKIYVLDGKLLIYPDLFKNRLDNSFVYIEDNPCENLEVGVNINEDNNIEHFSYGASKIWSEILYIGEKNTLEQFRKIISNIDFKNRFIFEALNELLKIKTDLGYVVNISPLTKINNIKTYHAVKEMI